MAAWNNENELQSLRSQLEKLKRNQLLQERIFDRQHALLRRLNHDYERAMATIEQQNAELRRLAAAREESLQQALLSNEELKRVSDELLVAKQEAEKANKGKDEFLAAMSHEIRTPLNVILGVCSLMLDEQNDLDAPRRVGVVRDAARHLMGLLNNILDYSRLSAGKVSLEEVDFDLREEVRSLIQGCSIQAKSKDLSLEATVDDSLPQWCKGDILRLRQILLNLLDNALKFTDQGEVRLVVASCGTCCGEEVRCRFEVRDTGIGIPPEKVDSVFRMFAQADLAVSRLHGGSGLGLSICAHLARLMGSEIRAASCPGQGSIFSFTVTLRQGQAPQGVAVQDAQEKRCLRVLLVDDHLPNAEMSMEVLENAGHEASHAIDVTQAMKLMAVKSFDVVLMDVELPGVSGIELTRRIRQGQVSGASADLPVFGVTAHVLNAIHERCLAAGMDAVYVKPVDFKEVLCRLKGVESRGQPEGDSRQLPKKHVLKAAEALEESVYRMQDYLREGECRQVKQEAHYLANTAAMVQAGDAMEMALELEKAAAFSALSQARRIWSLLEPRLRSLKRSLLAETGPPPKE